MQYATRITRRSLLRFVTGSTTPRKHRRGTLRLANNNGIACSATTNTARTCATSSSSSTTTAACDLAAAAAAAAATAAVLGVGCSMFGDDVEGCVCKSNVTDADSLQDYARRLQRLRCLRDIFDEYATVNAEGVGKLMTCGDFLRAMLCYRYVRVGSRELKRRCARYVNPLLGDVHGLISFDEFCFLLKLLSIPAGLFDVAFTAADSDGSGTIDVQELKTLVKRLAPADDDGGDDDGEGGGGGGDKEGDDTPQAPQLTGHKRLSAAWFGNDGMGSIPREEFASFVRDLRKDVNTVECRLYSSTTPASTGAHTMGNDNQRGDDSQGRGILSWWPLSWLSGGGSDGSIASEEGGRGGGIDGEGKDGAGWWSRYEHESISTADLALTLVSSSHPRDMPVLLARVRAIRKNQIQVPLNDALLLREVLQDHAQDLEDALGLYVKASSTGAVGMDDFARAANVVSGQDLSPECVWVVFKMFDSAGDGRLQHEDIIEATHDRLRLLPGQRDSPGMLSRFVHCVRGD